MLRLGRFAEAEEVLTTAIGRPSPETADPRRQLVALLAQEGRLDDAAG